MTNSTNSTPKTSDADALRHIIRAMRGYRARPTDWAVSMPAPGVFVVDVLFADASVEVTRDGDGWKAHASQGHVSEPIANVSTTWHDDVRVAVIGAVAACDALRWDLDDSDDGLDGLDVAELLAGPKTDYRVFVFGPDVEDTFRAHDVDELRAAIVAKYGTDDACIIPTGAA